MSQEPMWWYARANQQFGPFSKADFKVLAASGPLQATDLVWKEGFTDWVTAESVSDLLVVPPPPLPRTDPSQRYSQGIAPNREELMKTFVGTNYEYFANKWRFVSERKYKTSINWVTFFFPFGWTSYRKMYAYSWLIMGLCAGSTIVQGFLSSPFIALKPLAWVISPLINLIFATQANVWYRRHVEKKIEQITASSPGIEEAKLELARQGGTNWWAVVGFHAISLVIVLLMFKFSLIPGL